MRKLFNQYTHLEPLPNPKPCHNLCNQKEFYADLVVHGLARLGMPCNVRTADSAADNKESKQLIVSFLQRTKTASLNLPLPTKRDWPDKSR